MVAQMATDTSECESTRFSLPVADRIHSIQSGPKATGTRTAREIRGRIPLARSASAACPAYTYRRRLSTWSRTTSSAHGASIAATMAICLSGITNRASCASVWTRPLFAPFLGALLAQRRACLQRGSTVAAETEDAHSVGSHFSVDRRRVTEVERRQTER